jgi:hypothetical protein
MGLHYQRLPDYRCPTNIIKVDLGIVIRDLPWKVGPRTVLHSGILVDDPFSFEPVEELGRVTG